MLRRLVVVLVLVPVAVVLIALAVANRDDVALTFDPFSPGNPALTLVMPLFVWLFAAFALGMISGSIVTWIKQGRYRKAARRAPPQEAKPAPARPVPDRAALSGPAT